MFKKNMLGGRLSRRELLRSTGAGICFFYLKSILGCAPEADDQNERGALLEPQKGLIHPVRSPWFTKLDQEKVRCELCPKQCELAEGERAPCRVRENREGKLYTLAYANPALLQEDPIERKPFFHVLPGSRALSVSTAGCNLECKFCEVWDMALEYPENVYAHDVPPERVIRHARDSNVRSVSFAFGEPVIFFEYMAEVAHLAREAGLLNLIHTAGYIRSEPLQEIIEKIDAVNVDLKSFDEVFYRDVVGGELEPVLDTLRLLKDTGVHIEITNILIPTLNDDMEKIADMCKWIATELGADVPLHFARFYPLYKLSDLPRTPVSTLDEARHVAQEAGLKFVYIARVTDHEAENTFCPGCGKMVVERVGFVIEGIFLENGKCNNCGTEIPGKWA